MTPHPVVALTTIERVVAGVGGIVHGIAIERVVAFAAVERVVAGMTPEPVVIVTAIQRVGALVAQETVVTSPAPHHVIASATVEPVVVVRSYAYSGEHEIGCVQVINTEPLEEDRSTAVHAQINSDAVLIRGDRQVGKARYGGELLEVNEVFTIGEVGNGVVAIAGTDEECIDTRAAREGVVCGTARVSARHGCPLYFCGRPQGPSAAAKRSQTSIVQQICTNSWNVCQTPKRTNSRREKLCTG